MSSARSAALAEASSDPGSSAVVMQISGAGGGGNRCSEFCYFAGNRSSSGATMALSVALLLRAEVYFRTRGSERTSGGLLVFLNT